MARLTSGSCDFCQADSFEWYQSVCEGCGQSYCRTCGSAGPSYCDECGGPHDRGTTIGAQEHRKVPITLTHDTRQA